MQPLEKKKITQPLRTKKNRHSLGTKKITQLLVKKDHATFRDKKITLSIGPIAPKLVQRGRVISFLSREVG